MSDSVYDALRVEYEGKPLREDEVAADPMEQFLRWFDDATAAELPLANGMTLATVDAEGAPAARIVLLKDTDARGFVFFSNYDSDKGQQLAHEQRAALLFWWVPLSRQVRIEGSVERVDAAISDAYFAKRPRASNLSAMASPQSREVPDRAWLERAVDELSDRVGEGSLTRPPSWGGYRLVPRGFEFWQGRADRLHDRVCYRRDGDAWTRYRLAP
ncbi:pyridoxamine 5'-phosphate oxidase [Haliangium ochraceum]|uniref:Pyridoxamine 5'-phosphate oxidase n=1 Tax=Haliangium ochraceum (strain DSM 14365 / JCM 11303 / SMP-2) TaxID=502025 RepID=D0LW59_HALO1|nr:pyridoxamine 5'-phosphate oxidase [Haliangium ochraceum]ACY15991.1 pyridoxamine 5'-phosphate oxidase [Haliangium ochraceum DSM 14365]